MPSMTNHERVGQALQLLRDGLAPFVEREFVRVHRRRAEEQARSYFNSPALRTDRPILEWDAAALLGLMSSRAWSDVFATVLGHSERSYVGELRDVRNKWAHQEQFTSDDTERALDTAARLLRSVSASEADAVSASRDDLRSQVQSQQLRNQKKQFGGTLLGEAAASSLRPWREVLSPHADVQRGTFQQAEFAADLWQVYLNRGSDEYRDPAQFFRRTYLTDSLRQLLLSGVRRLSSNSGDPVVQLQTNFGGGKTHSMLALFHLFSGAAPSELDGVEPLLAEAGVTSLPSVRRVVLVGNKISPGNPQRKPDGTEVRTIWGELAWQLGGREAYERIRQDDEHATNPGDRLTDLFNDYGPCLILIDEWVAYARQLHDEHGLPGGDFETHFTFAQALTEAARSAERCLLLISLPASDEQGDQGIDDIEVGGTRGREALRRLRQVIGRMETPWRPASREEGFEIVRTRLFEPLSGEAIQARNLTARAFAELYQKEKAEFPSECPTADYERRLRDCYPIHPEVFDRLYTDWSTLPTFQRTRGVLRLMATVIHALWEGEDRRPLILPASIPIDDRDVNSELTRYLSDQWKPIIESDVDGDNSLPSKIDSEVSNLGTLRATRRVARTVYLGSAPNAKAAQRGVEDRRIKLGCVFPGDSPQVFGDALRRLAQRATYLYVDGARYWYSTHPTVQKLASDQAAEFRRNDDALFAELERRMKAELGTSSRDVSRRGDFSAIHLFPKDSGEVPDVRETRLVVLDPDEPYRRGDSNPALDRATEILRLRGNSARDYQNTLAFLAADAVRLNELHDAISRYLAWKSIVEKSESEVLDLEIAQRRSALSQRESADSTVNAQLPETYSRLLVPVQANARASVEWSHSHLSSSDALATRAAKRMLRDEALVKKLGSTVVRRYLETVPLWPRDGDHVEVQQLVDYFAKYLYLPRLTKSDVLTDALREGVASMQWQDDTFAYAESYDDDAKRYRGLRANVQVPLSVDDRGLIVRPDVAKRQLESEQQSTESEEGKKPGGSSPSPGKEPRARTPSSSPPSYRYYHGTVELDPGRVGREASTIATEVIAHLVGLGDADVKVTIDIEATLRNGVSDHVVRTVTENGRTLKFDQHSGFQRS